MARHAIQLHELSLMVALRRSLPACVGSPFGSLYPVILLSWGYINLAAPTGRRTVTCYLLLCPEHAAPNAVFAALAIDRWIEHQTGRSIRKFVKTARRFKTIQIQAGQHVITAADPCPKTSGQPSTKSTAGQLRTKLSQLR